MTADAPVLVEQAREAAVAARTAGCSIAAFEIGNEPNAARDYWRHDPERFGRAVTQCARAIWEVLGSEQLVISGGIHNPGGKAQTYLKDARPHFPAEGEGRFAVGFHYYPPGSWDPTNPNDGFRTLQQQFERLLSIAHPFPIADTESGCHLTNDDEVPERSEERQAANARTRWALCEHWGVSLSVVYQYQDGPDPSNKENTFGILRFGDTSERPIANAMRLYAESNHAT